MLGLLTVVSTLAVLIQGGYFPIFFLLVGVALGLGLAVSSRKLAVSPWLLGLFGLSAWYLVSTWLQKGDLAQGGLPLVCTLFAGCLTLLTPSEREKFVVYHCQLGGVVALLGILSFFGLLPLGGAVTAGRLQFTFQYVNAFGSYLAALALLRWQVEDRWVTLSYPLVLVALLLTRSAGAIGLFLVLQSGLVVIKYRSKLSWKPIVGLGLTLVGGIWALSTRWSQILGTFGERLTHTHDGFYALLASPILGYGAGTWGEVKNAFQSYDYRATVIHNSYMQVGVSGGVLALVLLLFTLFWVLPRLKSRPLPWTGAALLLVGHAVLDFTLCFFAIDCLALTLLIPQEEGRPLTPWGQRGLGVFCGLICLALRLV